MTEWGPTSHARPRIVVSRCLDLEACRYDGGVVAAPEVRALLDHAELVPVCPELAIGLGVPRQPIRIVVGDGGARRLIQPGTGRDLTHDMERFGASFLATLGEIDGILLKSRSPSCGVGDVKLFASPSADEPEALGTGLFAEGLVASLSELPIGDEVTLADLRARERFLTHAWTLARLREARRDGSREALVRFHAEHKLLLLAYHEQTLRELGPLVARLGDRSLAHVWDDYEPRFRAALARGPSAAGRANAVLHALGYFRARVDDAERRPVAERLAASARDDVVVDEVWATVRSWIVRSREPYLVAQAFFWPYPDRLRGSLAGPA